MPLQLVWEKLISAEVGHRDGNLQLFCAALLVAFSKQTLLNSTVKNKNKARLFTSQIRVIKRKQQLSLVYHHTVQLCRKHKGKADKLDWTGLKFNPVPCTRSEHSQSLAATLFFFKKFIGCPVVIWSHLFSVRHFPKGETIALWYNPLAASEQSTVLSSFWLQNYLSLLLL